MSTRNSMSVNVWGKFWDEKQGTGVGWGEFVGRVEAAVGRWPPKLCGGRSFPFSLLWRLGREELRARPLRLCVVSLQGLAVAKGGNHCLGAAGGLTVSVAQCWGWEKGRRARAFHIMMLFMLRPCSPRASGRGFFGTMSVSSSFRT